MKKTIPYLITILHFSLVSCKNYYNETIDWADSLVIESDIEMVKKSQPNFVEIDWLNPIIIIDGQEYYEIEIKNNRDILHMQNFLVFENKKYKGREVKK